MMTTIKLVTVSTQKQKTLCHQTQNKTCTMNTTGRRSNHVSRDIQHDQLHIGKTWHSFQNTKKSPTILTINQPPVTLLNNIIHDINHKHQSLCDDLRTLDWQQQEQHDTRIIQTVEYSRHHTTPDAEKHVLYPIHSTESYLIATSRITAALAATISTPHVTEAIHTLYTKWQPTLPPDSVFLSTDNPTDICRKYTLLHKVNASAIRMLWRITQ